MSNNNDDHIRTDNEEEEIDLLEIASKLWKSRRTIFKYAGIGALVGLVVAFSIPKEYTTTIKIAPELGAAAAAGTMGKLGSLASMAGINLNSANSGADAVMPPLYPDVVGSTNFLVGLFDVPVTESKTNDTYSVYSYLEDETSGTWWGYIFSLPFKALGAVVTFIRGDEEEGNGDGKANPFRLTKDQEEIKKALAERIVCSYDQETGVNTISVTMQNPLVSALLADTVAAHLQEFITDYRTSKARQDLVYAEQLNEEARKEYYEAQQRLANYLDRNQNLSFHSAQVERERLTNETNLAFSLFNQTSQQLQMAKAKVQENTPVYAIVEQATVPIKPSKPSKPLILIGFIFLGGVIACAKILFSDTINSVKKIITE